MFGTLCVGKFIPEASETSQNRISDKNFFAHKNSTVRKKGPWQHLSLDIKIEKISWERFIIFSSKMTQNVIVIFLDGPLSCPNK